MEVNKDKIRTFFAKFIRTDGLTDDTDIFGLGFVNSLFAMQLINWIEKEFTVAITDEDLEIRNFNTLNAIAGLLERKALAAR